MYRILVVGHNKANFSLLWELDLGLENFSSKRYISLSSERYIIVCVLE